MFSAMLRQEVGFHDLVENDSSVLCTQLASSASYIAVPAALKLAIPEASPSLYLGLSLGLTFPLNIILGIPFYSYLANWAI